MQLQKSLTTPQAEPGAPRLLNVPEPPPSRGKGRWIAGLLVVLASVAGLMLYRQSAIQQNAAQAVVAAVRSAPVIQGTLQKTIRLTGTTAAQNYMTLMTPQMRGSRSDFGRGGPSGNFSGGGSRGSSDRGGGGSGGGGSSSGGSSSSAASMSGGSSGGSSGSSAGGGGAAAGGSSGGGGGATSGSSSRNASAMASATSRVGGTRSSGTRSSSSGSRSSGSGSMGAEGLGTSGNLQGGGGGGGMPGGGGGSPGGGGTRGGGGPGGPGGGGQFSMVLQEVAKSGSRVKKGDVVAEFDRESMLMRLDDYKASVSQSEASFKRMEADMEVSRKNHEQTILSAEASFEKAKLDVTTTPVRSAIDAERLRLSLEEADARLKQLKQEVRFVDIGIKADTRRAELELQQTKIEYKRAEANSDRMVMKAPMDGLVVMQNMFRGTEFDQIKQGDQLFPGQSFMQIVEPGSMVINATINQVDTEKLRIGQKARVRFDAFAGLELPAKVYAIGTVAKSSRYRPDFVKEMAVVLKLEQMDPRVIPDLSVSADIILESVESATVIPAEAVFYESEKNGQGSQPVVYVKQGEAWQRRPVEIGLSNNIKTAVKAGLKPGEHVALEMPPRQNPAGA